MKETEDSRLIDQALNDEVFQRIYGRFKEQWNNLNSETAKLGIDRSDLSKKWGTTST